ncbi:mannitol dehydrogenase family protein [Poseidonocella pacifica]|nr:mannitol dehydrogenase family protein [Poseidonocella pacifica]
MRLSNSAITGLPGSIQGPTYDRAALTTGIVHIGLGNFHRAHQAVYLDDLFSKGLDHDWAICGAGVRAPDAGMRDALMAQDCLSTVIELSPEDASARIIGAMIDFVEVAPDNGPLIARISDASIRIVSLTVTEGGYFVDAGTGTFDPTHPDIVADAANPGAPRTVFGAIVAGLRARKDAGIKPFTVMSCDNLPGNGTVTRDAVVGMARLIDPALADWIALEVTFPNSMVDRITPATGDRERALARETFGLDDPVPVTCEPFRQWVMEDNFCNGRPRFEEAGVTLTSEVHTYERMKIRILNGGHAIIAYPAALLGIEYAHEAIAHPLVRGFFRKVETEEVLPHVAPVPEMTPAAYLELIESRVANPAVVDTTRRLCHDGSNRQPKFIVPSVRDGIRAGISVNGLALLSALWCRYCAGQIESGAEIAPNDPSWDMLVATAQEARSRPRAWLEMSDVYGDLAQMPAFSERFEYWLRMIWQTGTTATLETYIQS